MESRTGSHTLFSAIIMTESDSKNKTFIVRIQKKKATGGYYLYINIPKQVEKKLNLEAGDFLIIRLKDNKIIIKKL